MKVSTRFALGFLFISILLWTTAFLGGNISTTIYEQFLLLKEEIIPGAIAMNEVKTATHQIAHTTLDYILHGDAEDKAEIIIAGELLESSLAHHVENVSANIDHEASAARQLEQDGVELLSVVYELVSLKDQGAPIDAILKMDDEVLDPLIHPFTEFVTHHREEHIEEMVAAEEAVEEAYSSGMRLLYLLTGLLTIFAAVAASTIARSIVNPLRVLQHGTEMIGQGHLDYRVGTEAKDEIGQLSRAFDHMTDSLGRTTVSIEKLLDEINAREEAEVELRQRVAQIELLFKVAQRIGSELDLDVLVQDIVDTVRASFDYDGVMVLMLDDETNLLKLHSVTGGYADIFPKDLSIPLGEGMIGTAARKGKTLVSGDVSQDTHYVRKAGEVTNSELSIPIKAGNRVLAILDIQSAKFNAFDETDISGLETLAEQIAVAIENAQLYKSVQHELLERKQAIEALRESESRYRQVTESIDQYIYSLEIAPDGSLHSPLVTPSVTHFTGRSHNAHRKDTALWMEHIHPQDRGGVQNELEVLFAEDGVVSQTKVYRVVDIEENTRWVRDDIHVTRDEVGRAIRFDGVVTDITAIKEAQQSLEERNLALQAANERLQEIDQLKSTFLANMSHELRTPLNSIIGFSEIMIDGLAGELEDQQVEFIGDIHSSGKHLLALINDLLDISKIEAGKLELFPETFRIGALIQETVESINSLVKQKKQELIIEIPDSLPGLNADRFRIKQVLLNLLSNAHKFTPEGGEIAITAKTIDETALLCSVRDSGIGIAADDMELVFQEFKQVDGTYTREVQGTGLGLPISRRLIELHGGTIWAESVQGEGSTFSFLLPLDGPPDKVPVVFQEHQFDLTLPIESKRLVMIVEDDRRFANLLSFYFNREGFDVAQLFSGEKVLEQARLHKPCLISLDLMLPEIDGWQVLKELKSDPETAEIPVVILSALDEHEGGGEIWQELGAIDYIVKPLSREDLAKLTARAGVNVAGASRVLIVDDDDPTGRLMKLVFPLPEFETEYLTDPRNALEKIISDPPDVLVLDLMMPDLSGGELLERLRQDPRTQDLPIVILTAKNLTSEEQDLLGTMVGGIVRKGGREQVDELIRIVRETVKRDAEAGNG